MLFELRHRGPDELGYYFDDVVALGTARLSIVDCSSGQQPLADSTGNWWICFNGEIYNYIELRAELRERGVVFRTESDTEVLLQAWLAWGDGMFERLNGAFAFCIYNRLERSAILARDRFGKRPLFYRIRGNGLMFASEMKCFLANGSAGFEFDKDQLASILRIWTPIGEQTGYRDIYQVPAGCYLRVDERQAKVVPFFGLRLQTPELESSESEAVQRVYETLSHSVRLRLRGDVDCAAYLSGGLDSAAIASLMARHHPGRLKTFSIGFEDAEFDETSDQEALVSFLGTDHVHLPIGDRDIAEAFPEALWHAEVPAFRSAFVPMFLLSKVVSSRGIKVVLTGEGADEVFLGYDIFKETLVRQAWQRWTMEERMQRLANLYSYVRQYSRTRQEHLYAFFSRFAGDASSQWFSHEVRFSNSQLSVRLLNSSGTDQLRFLTDQAQAEHETYRDLTAVQRAQWLEFKTLLGGYLLSTQGDRMSLAHGVENRCPFLDPGVVQTGIATNLRYDSGFNEKYLLRRAFDGKLPAQILRKQKWPYRAPDASAFLRSQPDYLEKIRSQAELRRIDVLNADFCAAFLRRLESKPVEAISQAENQTFMFLLSIALLHERFVAPRRSPAGAAPAVLFREIDGRLPFAGVERQS
jgi:asparagine synthase (glutamine-hydrolysing)